MAKKRKGKALGDVIRMIADPKGKAVKTKAQRQHRAGARITQVQDAFKKAGELAAFRKGAALRLSCSSIYKWCMAWRAQGIEPVNIRRRLEVEPLTKGELKKLGKFILATRKGLAAMEDPLSVALMEILSSARFVVEKPVRRESTANAQKTAH